MQSLRIIGWIEAALAASAAALDLAFALLAFFFALARRFFSVLERPSDPSAIAGSLVEVEMDLYQT